MWWLMLSSFAQVFADSAIQMYITAGYVAASTSVNLLVFWSILPPDEGALHSQQTEHKAQHTQRQTGHQEPADNLNGAWSHTESRVHEAVSGGLVCSVVWLPYPAQTTARGSRSSCSQLLSLWNRISTGWTSTRPPWWWRSPPYPRSSWFSILPWPLYRQ